MQDLRAAVRTLKPVGADRTLSFGEGRVRLF